MSHETESSIARGTPPVFIPLSGHVVALNEDSTDSKHRQHPSMLYDGRSQVFLVGSVLFQVR